MSACVIDDVKLGILSDTHGSLPAWKRALEIFGKDTGTVFHAGDVLYHGPRNSLPGGYTPMDLADAMNAFTTGGGRLLVSEGNCDAPVDRMVLSMELRPYVSAVWRGKKILMMHGDNFPLLRSMALYNKVDLAISGHTHVASLVREEGTIFLNPGSTTIPKGRDPESVATAGADGIRIIALNGEELHFEEW